MGDSAQEPAGCKDPGPEKFQCGVGDEGNKAKDSTVWLISDTNSHQDDREGTSEAPGIHICLSHMASLLTLLNF